MNKVLKEKKLNIVQSKNRRPKCLNNLEQALLIRKFKNGNLLNASDGISYINSVIKKMFLINMSKIYKNPKD